MSDTRDRMALLFCLFIGLEIGMVAGGNLPVELRLSIEVGLAVVTGAMLVWFTVQARRQTRDKERAAP